MDIDNAEKKLGSLDRFLTTLKDVLKKHWGILIVILIGFFIYWIFTLPPVDAPLPVQEDILPAEEDMYFTPYTVPVVEEEQYYYEEQPGYEEIYQEEILNEEPLVEEKYSE